MPLGLGAGLAVVRGIRVRKVRRQVDSRLGESMMGGGRSDRCLKEDETPEYRHYLHNRKVKRKESRRGDLLGLAPRNTYPERYYCVRGIRELDEACLHTQFTVLASSLTFCVHDSPVWKG